MMALSMSEIRMGVGVRISITTSEVFVVEIQMNTENNILRQLPF